MEVKIIAPRDVPVAIFIGRPIKNRSAGTKRKPPPSPSIPAINPATAPIGIILYRSFLEGSVLCPTIFDLKNIRTKETARATRYSIFIVKSGIYFVKYPPAKENIMLERPNHIEYFKIIVF